jgi:hypothetical protein
VDDLLKTMRVSETIFTLIGHSGPEEKNFKWQTCYSRGPNTKVRRRESIPSAGHIEKIFFWIISDAQHPWKSRNDRSWDLRSAICTSTDWNFRPRMPCDFCDAHCEGQFEYRWQLQQLTFGVPSELLHLFANWVHLITAATFRADQMPSILPSHISLYLWTVTQTLEMLDITFDLPSRREPWSASPFPRSGIKSHHLQAFVHASFSKLHARRSVMFISNIDM